MLGDIRNPYVRRPLIVIAAPFIIAFDLLVGFYLAGEETVRHWWRILKRSW